MSQRERVYNFKKSPCSTRAAERRRCGELRSSCTTLGKVCCLLPLVRADYIGPRPRRAGPEAMGNC